MKRTLAFAVVITFGLFSLSPGRAQTTVFSDTFTSDSSLAQPPWYNLNNTSAASYALNPAAAQGLALTVSSGTGKVNQMFAEFTPVSLSTGGAVTLTVLFNSSSGMATDTGGLLAGLYNNATVNSTNEQGSAGVFTASKVL
ncbi:MAG TPA: hypothetical protein VGY56_20250 [Verrucomicrobiae bacterium]|nr:hypothetical protein [Verrucomicrobiae bacterium]